VSVHVDVAQADTALIHRLNAAKRDEFLEGFIERASAVIHRESNRENVGEMRPERHRVHEEPPRRGAEKDIPPGVAHPEIPEIHEPVGIDVPGFNGSPFPPERESVDADSGTGKNPDVTELFQDLVADPEVQDVVPRDLLKITKQ
jgi:hypothetical protein